MTRLTIELVSVGPSAGQPWAPVMKAKPKTIVFGCSCRLGLKGEPGADSCRVPTYRAKRAPHAMDRGPLGHITADRSGEWIL